MVTMATEYGCAWGGALGLVEADLAEVVERHGVPGISAAAVHDQSVAGAWGVGLADRATGTPATPETVYRVASITKLFTATMLLRLRDAGKLHLDDPLQKHLPEVRFMTEDADPRPVTLRQISAHMAGIPRDLERDYFGDVPFPTVEELVAEAATQSLRVPPLTHFKYSNVGYALLGQALARVAGEPYEDYVTRHILEPLGMSSSGFEPTGVVGERLAQGYTKRPGEDPVAAPYTHVRGMAPTGQLQTSVLDATKFLAMQFRDDPAGAGQILGAATLREMHTPVWMEPDWKGGHCIGWHALRVGDRVALGHGGGVHGFATQVMVVPSAKLGVAVFSNAILANGDWGPEKAATRILELLLDRMPAKAPEAPGTAPAEWQAYVGTYGSPYWSRIEVRLVAGRLYLASAGGKPGSETPLEHVEGRAFRAASGAGVGETAAFIMDDAGLVTGMEMPGSHYVRLDA
jgi:CubicO group peptidase (beta-lactamase class C family)